MPRILSCLVSFCLLRWEELAGVSLTFASVRNSGPYRSGLVSLLWVSINFITGYTKAFLLSALRWNSLLICLRPSLCCLQRRDYAILFCLADCHCLSSWSGIIWYSKVNVKWKNIISVLLVEAQIFHIILNFAQCQYHVNARSSMLMLVIFLCPCLCSNFDFLSLILNYFNKCLQFLTIQVHFTNCFQRGLFIPLLKGLVTRCLTFHYADSEVKFSHLPLFPDSFSFLLQLSVIPLIWHLFPFFKKIWCPSSCTYFFLKYPASNLYFKIYLFFLPQLQLIPTWKYPEIFHL